MNINDGGPAFPYDHTFESVNERKGYTEWHGEQGAGMSLRDYIAAKALAAMIGHESKDPKHCAKIGAPLLAKYAYEFADAMLEAREATGETQAS
jgi:hypothetical protein